MNNAVNERQISAPPVGWLPIRNRSGSRRKSTRNMRLFLDRMNVFLLKSALHDDRYNRLYAPGVFKIEYIAQKDEQLQQAFTASAAEEGGEVTPIPEITGPIIRFANTDLLFATHFDSTGIKDTQGLFLVISDIFVGKGGKFDWASLDLDPNQVYCEFEQYTFDVSKPIFNAKNARLTYTLLLSKTIQGNFEFVSKARKDIFHAAYPKFRLQR
ncbi:MAG: hypothetical protein HC880_09855 [Bacteroidia bacterium]|nr:hypothetical protein [Bacteroidia bacterium]